MKSPGYNILAPFYPLQKLGTRDSQTGKGGHELLYNRGAHMMYIQQEAGHEHNRDQIGMPNWLLRKIQ